MTRAPLPDAFLRCSVRGCGLPLDREGQAWRCAARHSFDVARSGYLNLLQPQDKKSRTPGDARNAVQARRRFLDSGALQGLIDELLALEPPPGGPPRRLLDVGCGEGYFTARLARAFAAEGIGVDLSSEACDAAARTHRDCSFVVGNADRELPFVDQSFDRIVSITARRNAPELARVLAPGGDVLLVVAGRDDLRELRELLHGSAPPIDRTSSARSEMASHFAVVSQRAFRTHIALDRCGIDDVLAMTYRGARHREAARISDLEQLHTTLSAEILQLTLIERASDEPAA